jgi:general secretion pathway protein D
MLFRFVSFTLVFLFLFSCAPKKEIVKKEEAPPPAPEKLILPELPPEPEPEVEQKPKKVPAVRLEQEADEQFIILNFDNTDIQTVISTFAELLHINYILTPGISGTVTIQSYKKFPFKDLFQIFQSILEVNGLTAVKDGEFYRIVPIDTARQQPVDVAKGKEAKITLDSSFITQLVPLEYVKASEVAKILKNYMSRGTDLIVYEPANLLIITALPHTLVKFMKIIEALDVSESEQESIKTFVYYVENGEAKKLADILTKIFAEKRRTATVVPKTLVPRRKPTPATPVAIEALPGDIGEITITAYEDINALIIKSTPRAYLALLEVLKKIDVPVKQVLIEVLIAEITLTDSFQFGLEWLIKTASSDTIGFTTSTVESPPTITTGHPGNFAAVVSGSIDSAMFNYVLTTLATKTKVNILASPHILAMDNKEAKIEIGSEVPTATGLTQQPATGGGTTLVTSGQIQYKTVGTLLTVTPHITEKGNVSMKLVIESSSLSEKSTIIGSGTFPTFETRKATTSAVVKNGHTLFLGGLISDKRTKTRSGIPFLSKIPIIGYLFSSSSDSTEKTELLVMVTPHVVSNQQEADALTKRFQDRVRTIKKRIADIKKQKNPIEEENADEL